MSSLSAELELKTLERMRLRVTGSIASLSLSISVLCFLHGLGFYCESVLIRND